MPNYRYTGAYPATVEILPDYHTEDIEPGDVREFDEDPGAPWELTKKKVTTRTELPPPSGDGTPPPDDNPPPGDNPPPDDQSGDNPSEGAV